jgi:hypothetical protein
VDLPALRQRKIDRIAGEPCTAAGFGNATPEIPGSSEVRPRLP